MALGDFLLVEKVEDCTNILTSHVEPAPPVKEL